MKEEKNKPIPVICAIRAQAQWMDRQTDRQTQTDRSTDTDRQIDRHRQTNKQGET